MAKLLRHLLICALALPALALAMPAAASASAQDVLNDCFDDDALSRQYTRAELRAARRQMEADFETYSECDNIIDARLRNRAIASTNRGVTGGEEADRAVGGGSGGGGSGTIDGDPSGSGSGSADIDGDGIVSPEEASEKRQLAKAETERQLGDRAFDPFSGAAISSDDASNGLPLPVLLALIALTLLLATGALMALHQRNPAFMGALRRVPFPRRRR
ncbi:MAG: hypothetical protein WKF29_01655 [Thermoleophilaceae bacterium]